MISSEVQPYARTGGLGDVLGALPRALAGRGHEIKVFMPLYHTVELDGFTVASLDWSTKVSIDGRVQSASSKVIRDRRLPLEHYLIECDAYFERPALYQDPETGKDFADNDERFVLLCRAALEAARHLEWAPDVVHVHDWQTAVVPALLKYTYVSDPLLSGARSVLTIHNVGYQGVFPPERYPVTGLPPELFYAMSGAAEFYGKVNYLKAGIICADKVTTVSPKYAEEISGSEEFGHGLQDVLNNRGGDLVGILNGVDYTIWSPSRDHKIPYRYNPANLSGKRKTRIELINKAGLPVRENVPLVGMITRLADQKGIDLVAQAADRLFGMNLQMILLGTGDPKYHELFRRLEQQYPDKLKAYLKFDDDLAHQIEAASDMFLMPSRYEPCGLGQLYALRYGTVPIVRSVGGLADTVTDYDPETGTGTGFAFTDYTVEAMLTSLERAIAVYARKRKWSKIMKAGMAQDFSWETAAGQYIKLYQSLQS